MKLLRHCGIASGISVVLEVVNSIPVSSFFFIGQQASMLMLPFFRFDKKMCYHNSIISTHNQWTQKT